MSQQETKDMATYFYRASAADFMKIPGSPVAYWLSKNAVNTFTGKKLFDIGITRRGLQTGEKDRFIRYWHECNLCSTETNLLSRAEAVKSQKRWFLFNNGGDFRKWYGNLDLVVNWERNGRDLKNFPGSIIPSEAIYFQEGICWPRLGSGVAGFRLHPTGYIPGDLSPCFYSETDNLSVMGLLNSKLSYYFLSAINPTVTTPVGDLGKIPFKEHERLSEAKEKVSTLIELHKVDWRNFETAIDFDKPTLIRSSNQQSKLQSIYQHCRSGWHEATLETQSLEEDNNKLFIEVYDLQRELSPVVPLEDITLICNPHYRYGSNRSEGELETLLQCDTLRELVSYAIGCMMGRYSLDKLGLVLASQGETLQDYLRKIPSPRFAPDDDAILPLTDQEWFNDDATNRFREFVRVVWGDEHLQQNLDFVAESLCLHAIKPKRGESALDTIRRYLSTQFYKDHLRTYKKRPIYWLFSSGKHKAFECLVYLHRYNEGTLARMRTEYVIPLSAKLNAYAEKLEQDKEASTSAAENKRLEKEIATLHKQQAELAEFDEKLRHYADQRISLDLDDGVKVNYGKFGDLLAEVKAVTGQK
ncbi:BREX-1 system adenine-specific DNA-methyltransferase PglX [Marinobacter nauticus]|uniref:BREX-1 system adenine-specific DNA-methyltransferase PglX n=1 Tax=Marinobacter nauticus TaxID=2743 RepID=UPI001D19862C|nr:BREX-1 system adenine-specific DNA-methyltransferase PglX [Marinobacter nauticus]MCC4272204.1 BREX-1 system adenine-specific DNA-methyltransferase PglX [Marinobacter nauticus]